MDEDQADRRDVVRSDSQAREPVLVVEAHERMVQRDVAAQAVGDGHMRRC
jgi:hypothetical protein